MSTAAPAPLTTPLYEDHQKIGGRIVDFAGYLLPVQYQGVIAESLAVRNGAGMFDVSHMARLKFTGDRVLEFLDAITTNDVSKLADGQGQYSLLPNKDGGLVDDIIVYRINQGEYKMVVNAANHAKDVAHITALNTYDVNIQDYSDSTAMIAVQGPKATDIVASISADPNAVLSTPFFGTLPVVVGGVATFAARSGYTGEDGYELQCLAQDAPRLWRMLLEAGVEPCGLGSRDTLRVEAGLPLYGHELSDDMSPMCAGLGWVISKTKKFVGSGPINESRANGTTVKLHGIKLESKRVPSPGMEVMAGGNKIGTVSSGVYSPLLECGIAFAFLNSDVKAETACEIGIRGTKMPGTIVNKRFFKRS